MKIIQNVDTSLKTMRLVMFVVLVVSFSFAGYIYIYSMNEIDINRNKVYLLNQGNALELVRSRNGKDNIVAEIKSHVSMFHEFFYNLDPDPVDIKTRINKALVLIDESGVMIQAKRNEALYYHNLVNGSISSRVYVDSINVVLDGDKYQCTIFARQKLIRSTKVTEKNIYSQCAIRTVSRTDSNPHGFIIEQYKITNNSPINETTNTY
jgi:conjugative transposon TraK protein